MDDIKLGEVLVSGITYRTQRAAARLRCTICPEAIVAGTRYVRVVHGKEARGNPDVKVERYHVSCFRREFTNATG